MTKVNSTHPGEQDLRTLYELGIDAPDARQLVLHVKTCTQCTGLIRRMRSFDTLLRRAVSEQAPKRLSLNVMREIGIPEESTMVYRALQYAAPIFALIIVAALVGAAFYFTGAYKQPELATGITGGQSLYSGANKLLATGGGLFGGWMKDYFSFLYQERGVARVFFLALFFVAIGLMDRFVFGRVVKRRV